MRTADFVDLAPAYRQRNWGPSCGWATTVMMLRAQGLHREADWIRANRSGGSGPHNINPTLKQLGVRYVFTTDGDERVLERALATNRGCGIGWGPYHATMLVGRVNGEAVILDNNRPGKYVRMPWSEFVRQWKSCPPMRGWAWMIVSERATPAPQTPFLGDRT